MEMKDLQYFFEGLSETLGQYFDEIYDTLVAKGKKRMGQETKGESPQISELIKRTREEQSFAELVARGKKGQEELIGAIGGEVKKILASAGVVTRPDLKRIEKRMEEIEQALEAREKSASRAGGQEE